MTIMIDDRREPPDLPAETERLLDRILRTGIERTEGPRNVQVSLLLTGDAQIREMNREFRGVDRSTDVLSFPMLDYLESGGVEDKQLVYETDPETGEVMLGDIVVSMETALRQAGEYGHGLDRELAFLAVHGLLHLRGYDHERESGRRRMRAKEEEILALANLTRDAT